MIPKASMRVLVDYVADGKSSDTKLVFVRPLDFVHFRVTRETTLGSCPVAMLGLPPRTTNHDQIITLILKNRNDLQRLSVGHEALLEHIELIQPNL
ncbi:MAG: hypothetical protein ACRYFS_20255 [Janthinobacterium lividum]